MLSAKDVSLVSLVNRVTWAAAVGLAVINLPVGLALGGGLIWLLVLALEAGAVALLRVLVKRWAQEALQPMEELLVLSERSKASALQAHDLHRLAKKLERVEEPGLAQRLTVAGSGEDMSVLLEALNDMMDRIDRRYQAQKRFTGDASHELKTPLAVIISYVDRLDRKGRDNPAVRDQCISVIQDQARLMKRLVEDLLMLARRDSETQKLVLRPLDLSLLVEELARQHQELDGAHRMAVEVQPGVTAVADGDLLRRCLWVLTENAQKYTPDQGEIRIRLEAEEGKARITVADTGIGISEGDLPHVFERFYRADASRARDTGGTGLGLPIAQAIAGYHQGTLTVESKVGEGTAFTLTIPLEQKEE